MPKLDVSCPFRAAARAGAAATLAVGLFASSPYTNEARAIDISPTTSNAALVFSSAIITGSNGGQLCAHNYNKVDINAVFIFAIDYNAGEQQLPVTIEAESTHCNDFFLPSEGPSIVRPAIVLNSPVECSQASEYPGKCRLVASFEIYPGSGVISDTSPIRHMEPVLLPTLPPNPHIIVPFPQ